MGISRASLIGIVVGLSFALAGLDTANAQDQFGTCHGGFPLRFLGHCFRVTKRATQQKNWLSARRDCESIFSESHLLTDMTQEIHDQLVTKFTAIDSYWLGLNDRGVEGEFYWGNPENDALGSPTQWDPSSPNDDAKDCVAMTRSSNYNWVPTDCSTKMAFICAQDVNECVDNPCHEFADCANTDGSYTCTCRDGYTGDGTTCTNLCGQPCGENAECRNSGGSAYQCTCDDGFEGDGFNCVDHDECAEQDEHGDHCHEEHGTCVNYIGGFDCICKPGYQRTSEGMDKCVDVDECHGEKLIIPCPGHSHCENTDGSFICQCDEGHRYEGFECVDIDECAEGSHTCPSSSMCTNMDGTFNCNCGTQGYVVDSSGTCVDLNECQQSPSPCHVNAACTNNDGSYTCACRAGFQGDGKTCTDIDECAAIPGQCHALATCTNTVGSYQCRCPDGFQGDGITSCADEDECLATPPRCPDNNDCTNTVGSFSCQCKTGFTGPSDNCIDTDECAASPSPCLGTSQCINTPGTYVCVCTAGYTYIDSACKDVDECAALKHNCDQNADCENEPGSFTCTCRTGYVGDGSTCTDENECERTPSPCSPDKTCSNTVGSYTCTCRDGYRPEGNTCVDVNECNASPSPCHQQATCQNTQGSFTCTCNDPYIGNGIQCTNSEGKDCVTDANGVVTCSCKTGFTGDGVTCSDVNECTQTPTPCHQQATCTNTLGSYTCRCNTPYKGNGVQCTNDPNTNCVIDSNGGTTCTCTTGFVGNGYTCNDADECAQTPYPCHQQATCTNTLGSYTCRCNSPYQGNGVQCTNDLNSNCVTNANGLATCTCRPGFTGNGFICRDVNECAQTPTPCHRQATCTNILGSYTCRCNTPYKGNGVQCTNDANTNCATVNGVTTCTCKDGYSGDGYTCSDVDECANNLQRCAANADCTNTVGSYTCTCRPPYKGDGRTACVDASNANCVVNNAGVEVCSCKAGFTGSGFNCINVNECAEEPSRCHQQATCTDTPGSFQCTCKPGYQGDGVTCRSSASVTCTGDNLTKQRYQIVLDDVTLTAELQDTATEEYRAKKTEIELLLEPMIRRTQHGNKVQSVVVTELSIVEDEVVAVYVVCLQNGNTVHGLDIQNDLRAANSVDNTLGVNLKTVCYLESNNDNCPTSQALKQSGQSALSTSTATALGIALGALFLLLLIAIACWAKHHKKTYGKNRSVGSAESAPSVYASTYHHPQLFHTSEHLYPTPSGPTVWPTVASESIPSTFPAGSAYY
ncbi:FBN3 [Branchiostoma lanceolatum]|uniref:FBN3 protein n=1 Tax=Branchiostoma lanceolatum TaxID=7740 RepID=A0A8J9W6N6_BRALA|nr:FBN3 [Branchiostoma lanceolatum]